MPSSLSSGFAPGFEGNGRGGTNKQHTGNDTIRGSNTTLKQIAIPMLECDLDGCTILGLTLLNSCVELVNPSCVRGVEASSGAAVGARAPSTFHWQNVANHV